MTTADAILEIGFYLIMVLLLGGGSALLWAGYTKVRSLFFGMAVIPFALMMAVGAMRTVVEGDPMYFVWWVGIAMVIVSVLMVLYTQSLDVEEEGAPEQKVDPYIEEKRQYAEGMKVQEEATAPRVPRSRKRR